MDSIQPALQELERIYNAFEPRFPADLPRKHAVITIQAAGRRTMLGWCAPATWANQQDEPLNEITICAEHLARPVEDIAEVVAHEMVHHFNAVRGVRDCTTSQYHNRAFRDLAECIGLECKRQGHRGWAHTALGLAARQFVQSLNINADAFSLFRRERTSKAATRMLKWTCGCTIVRCATILQASCTVCGRVFVQV